jgi:hypothetical protein
MLGLMYLGAITVYLVVMVIAIRWGWRAGRLNGRGWAWGAFGGFVGFLVIYLPVFWNHIPVVLEHRRLCAKDAGFTVYVTAAEWARDNQDLKEALRGTDPEQITESTVIEDNGLRLVHFGGALVSETKRSVNHRLGVQFWRVESTLLDARQGTVMTRGVGYSVGPKEALRFWLVGMTCSKEADDYTWASIRYKRELREFFQ